MAQAVDMVYTPAQEPERVLRPLPLVESSRKMRGKVQELLPEARN
jgi:hypothetical protein